MVSVPEIVIKEKEPFFTIPCKSQRVSTLFWFCTVSFSIVNRI